MLVQTEGNQAYLNSCLSKRLLRRRAAEVPPSIERFSVAKVMDISEFAKEKRELFCFFPKKHIFAPKL